MICDTARCPPIIEYFEFDPHLIMRNPYAEILSVAMIIIILIVVEFKLNEKLNHLQHNNITPIAKQGPLMYIKVFLFSNFIVSLLINLVASVIG